MTFAAASAASADSAAAWSRRIGRRFPQRLAIADGDRRLCYGELDERVERLAGALRLRGVRRGDRIAALLVNGLPLIELYLAAARLGAILLPLNWRLSPVELGWIIGNAEPRILFRSPGLPEPEGADAGLATVIVGGAGEDEHEALLAGADAGGDPEAVEAHDDGALPWIMLYTSGTTGHPKGCLLSQQGQVISAYAMATQLHCTEKSHLLLSLPLFHVGGTSLLFSHMAVGAAITLAPRHFDAEAARQMASALGCDMLGIAPQLLPAMVEAQRRDPLPLALRTVTMGGGMHRPQLVEEVRAVLGCEPILSYGQTEAGNFVACLRGEEQIAHPKSCGRPTPQFDIRIMGEGDRPLPVGEVGELCLRGPSVLTGYWRNPEATQSALRGGWLHSGDLAMVDEHGLITLMGRSKELIKTGGENVYPKEVEAVLLAHPDIADCAIFGVADDHWGEAVKALVALHPGRSMTPRQAADWVRAHIAGYKRPRFVEFIAALPRTDTGKLLTRELQARPVTPDQCTD